MRWTKHGYGTIGSIELAAILLAIIVLIIGILAFTNPSFGILIIFIILAGLSALFLLAIIIFVFISTKTRFFDEYLGCNGDYRGMLSIWNSVDNYLYSVDSLLCSPECPCYFDEKTANHFASNSTTAPYYNMWDTRESFEYATKFQHCLPKVQGLAKAEYSVSNAYFNHTFDTEKFNDYYARIEKYFKCTGFCGTTYYNGKTQTNQKIVKYLFSDIDEYGIPDHFGCLPLLFQWLRKTLNAFAAVCCFLFVILLLLIILAILLLLLCRPIEREETKPEEEPPKEVEPVIKPPEPEPEPEPEIFRSKYEPNTSYNPPQSQIDEQDMVFNPSQSKNL